MPNAVTVSKLQDVEETAFVMEVSVVLLNGFKTIPKQKNEIQRTNDYYPFRLYQYL
jgi:hypothetical protein